MPPILYGSAVYGGEPEYPGSCFDPPPDSTVVLTELAPEEIEQDFYHLLSSALVGETLQLRVGFSGCGPDHPFTLYAGLPLTDPYPARTWSLLAHDSREEICAAYFEKDLSFDLHPLVMAHIRQYGFPGDIRLRFQEFGGGGRELLLQPNLEFVSGSVVEVVDMVPVDGGVTVRLATDANELLHLIFPSLYRAVPPPDWAWPLYQKLSALEPGDLVWAQGVPVETGLLLRDLGPLLR